jgi:hypothetical protein
MVFLGFIGSREMQGVTSFCRFWGLGPGGYYMASAFLSRIFVVFGSVDHLLVRICSFSK